MAQKFNPLSGQFDIVFDKAVQIKYDPSAVTLTATNVQDAIDELSNEIDNLPIPITYKGTWDASTNTPTLENTDVGREGWLYQVNVAGTVDFGAGPISFEIGDKVVNNAAEWQKWDMTDQVFSVNGQQGNVVLTANDVGAADQQLSNLVGPTAVPVNLYPVTDAIIDLGGPTLRFLNIYTTAIADSAGITVLDVEAHTLFDSAGDSSVDANNRLLVDSSGSTSVDYENHLLPDAAGITSLNWSTRQLIGPSGTVVLNWSTAGSPALNMLSHKITNLASPTASTDGANKTYVDNAVNSLNAISALTGDVTASGPGSVPATLATVNSNVGTFGAASNAIILTVNGKGLVTAAADTPILIAESQVTNLVSDLAGKQPVGNYITDLTGDATASGPGSVALTLATVNSNVGSFTNANITVDAKGRITAASNGSAVTAVSVVTANGLAGSSSGGTTPALTLSTTVTGILKGNGTAISAAVAGDFPTLNQNTTGTAANVTGVVAIANGGTGQTTKTAAFDALSPTTTKGDVIVSNGVNNVRQAVGVNGQVPTADSTSATGISYISPAVAPKNYLSTVNGINGNGNFELGSTSKWSTFGTTLTGVIPTGAIGAPAGTISTFTTSFSPQLAGNFSLAVGSTGGFVGGDGFISDAFTIDIEDQAKVMTIKFYYKNNNGTNANFSGTSSNTYAVYVYDVTNSAWIQPAGVYGMTQGTGIGLATATFQTTSNSTQYRLAIVCVNGTGSQSNVQYDDFFLGPQTAPLGLAGSDWATPTPNFTLTNTGNAIVSGSIRRIGDSVEAQGTIVIGSSLPTGTITLNLPSNLVINSARTNSVTIGEVSASNSGGTAINTGVVGFNSTTSVLFRGDDGVGAWTASVPQTFVAGDRIDFFFTAAISGWSSNVQMSNDTDTRVVAAKYVSTAGTSIANSGADINVPFPTIDYDTTASYNTSTGIYTVPVSGKYQISSTLNFSSQAYVAGNTAYMSVYKNGTLQSYGPAVVTQVTSSVGQGVTISAQLSCNAGDTLEVRVANNRTAGASTVGTGIGNNHVEFARLSGPATIAATDSVNASYSNTAGTAVSNTFTTIPFATKLFDTTNSYATNTYIVPVSGKYRISAIMTTTSVSLTTTQSFMIQAVQAGSASVTKILGNAAGTGGANAYSASGSGTFSMLAGDTLVVQAFCTTSTSLNTATGYNHFELERIGN